MQIVVSKGGVLTVLEPVTFEDFSVDFTEEEWGPLDPAHRKLHRAEMPQPYSHLVSMGKNMNLDTCPLESLFLQF